MFYGLVDAVSFYSQAEKVFDLNIRNKPVVVLTNNDGCICAVCPIARALGVPKFEPYFKVRKFLEQNNVVVRSSNYELYGDLSSKMMSVISRFADNSYVYSIDEMFLQFDGYSQIINDWYRYGHDIRKAVYRETKLPVGVGVGLTPTQSKAANHAAKKLSGFDGVAVISDMASANEIYERMKVTDVWGVGSRLGKKLEFMGIHSAKQLAKQSPKKMRKYFSVVVERTVEELNGQVCLNWDDVKPEKKEIFSTRAFGEKVECINELKSALVTHASIVAKKLREQHSIANRLIIFAHSSPHDTNYYKQSFIYSFSTPSSDSRIFANAVNEVVDYIYKRGVRFSKAGLGAVDLTSERFYQSDLFNKSSDNKALMSNIDLINSRFGSGTISIASEQQSQKWSMRREFLSPRYTTRWSDIPRITC